MKVSLIIPALNEAARISESVHRAMESGADEIIVVDGGSRDATAELAHAADLVLTARKGRAHQQNAGANAASGDVLLFLHADCWLESGAIDDVRKALRNPRCIGGCFRQIIDSSGLSYRLLEYGNALRSLLLGWTYGDQGLFIRHEVFSAVGGFPELPFMEDLHLSKRLRNQMQLGGWTLLGRRLHVSPRRWQRVGIVRQTLLNWRLIVLAHAGVPLETLLRRYQDAR